MNRKGSATTRVAQCHRPDAADEVFEAPGSHRAVIGGNPERSWLNNLWLHFGRTSEMFLAPSSRAAKR